VREGVLDALGLDPARLMIALSHTHAGPSLCREDADQPGGRFIAPYLNRLRDALIRAARQALSERRPATLTWSVGRCGLAQNRDLPDPAGGRFLCGYHPSGAPKVAESAHHPPTSAALAMRLAAMSVHSDGRASSPDDTLLVGRVTLESGAIMATLVNYACHPTTLAWENRLISPDYVGAMRETVEAHTGGAPCLYLHGASGELAPRDQYTADTAVADANGRALGYAALSVLAGMLPPRTELIFDGVVESGAPLAIWKRAPAAASSHLAASCVEVELPLKPDFPTLEELDAALSACADRALIERLLRKRRIRQSLENVSAVQAPLWAWRAGDTLFAGHPNEAYSVLQTYLRQRFPEQAVVVMNVVNGHAGYLPPESLYDEDIYPVWQTPMDRGCLEKVIAAAEQALDKLVVSKCTT
jgi:hypothetical protein